MTGIWEKSRLASVRYAVRCAKWRLNPALMRCPSCQASNAAVVARKAWVTDLVQCIGCHLLYRRPQEPEGFAERFYQEEYSSGLTTSLPEQGALATMLSSRFKGSEKDLSGKIAVLQALGVPVGSRVLDYGASWGYGVWQLNDAGYKAEGFELSRVRATQGMRILGVTIHTEHAQLLTNEYDAVFTNHVLEHIPNSRAAFEQIASTLRPGGWLVAFFPNGSDECRKANPTRFQCNWGRLHPIYLNHQYVTCLLNGRPHWMVAKQYDTAPDVALLQTWNRTDRVVGDMRENEMMLVARF